MILPGQLRQHRPATTISTLAVSAALVSVIAILTLFATIVILTIYSSPAGAAGWPVKPDFCYVVNPGTADVEIVFFPSKLNITVGDGADNATVYRITRSDGVQWHVQRNGPKSLHDTGSVGTVHGYVVASLNDQGQASQDQPCIAFDAVSSVSPGRLLDWQRPNAVVVHGLDAPAIGSSTRRFTGQDNDVVTTEVDADETDLNPNGGQFVYQAALTLTGTDLDVLRATPDSSWNVMQRGYADSAGGQWKMSLVISGPDQQPRAQCAVRDGQGGTIIVNSSYVLQPDVKATITCVVDDLTNSLQIIVNGRTDSPNVRGSFGNVNPWNNGSSCWQKVARTISVGNKPACSSLTADDRFQGSIHLARVLKG